MDEWTRDAIIAMRQEVRRLLIRTNILLFVCGLTCGLLLGRTFL